MAQYGPLDQVTDHGISFTTYDFPSASNVIWNFGTAGYAADAILNIAAQGKVQIFGYDSSGATLTVTIAGVAVPLDGTGSAFALRDHLDATKCYFQYNLPNAQNQVYTFKAVFSFANLASYQVYLWQNTTAQ